MWLGIDEFVYGHRIVFFTGPFGSGKTLGAVALAFRLWAGGYTVVSNVPVLFSTPLSDIVSLRRVVLLLDEGRRYVDSRSWKDNIQVDYLRHLDSFLVISSAYDVDVRFRRLTLERVLRYSFLGSFSSLFWLYRLTASDVDRSRPAVLLAPRAYWGLYPHRHIIRPDEDRFFYLLSSVFDRMRYSPPKPSLEDEKWVSRVIENSLV